MNDKTKTIAAGVMATLLTGPALAESTLPPDLTEVAAELAQVTRMLKDRKAKFERLEREISESRRKRAPIYVPRYRIEHRSTTTLYEVR